MQRSIVRILTTHVSNPPPPIEGTRIADKWVWS
jgi:hypothetical protein